MKLKNLYSCCLILLMTLGFVPVSFAQDEGEYDGPVLGIERIPAIDDAFDDLSEAIPFGYETGFSLASEYIWRGQTLAGDVSWQPWFTISADTSEFSDVSLGAFAFTYWANISTNQPGKNTSHTETDLVFDYSVNFSDILSWFDGDGEPEEPWLDFNYNFGVIRYQFPTSAPDDDTTEIYFGFTLDTILSPSLYLYHDWDAGSGQWWEFSISHDFDLKAFTLSTYAKLGYNCEQWASPGTSQFTTFDFGWSIPIPVGAHMTFEPFLSYSSNLNGATAPGGAALTSDVLYGGVNHSLSF